MSRLKESVQQQDKAMIEIRRVLNARMKVMTSDEFIENASAADLEMATLYEGILSMFDIYDEKVTAGVLIASAVEGWNLLHGHQSIKQALDAGEFGPIDNELVVQAKACLDLMLGPKDA